MNIKKKKYVPNKMASGWQISFHIILATGLLICLLPIILVYIISVTGDASMASKGYSFFPTDFSTRAYSFFMRDSKQIFTSFKVSVLATLIGAIGGVLVMSMYAYVISRKDFKYSRFLSYFAVFTMLFNGGMVPSYIINSSLLKLNDTLLILILPFMVNAFYIMMLRTFFRLSVPDAVIESARLDGAGEISIFFHIVLPMAKPALATIGLFLVVELWNDWFYGLLYITDPGLVSLQYMLMKIQNTLEFIRSNTKIANSAQGMELMKTLPTESGRMALTVLVMTPVLFAYPFFQRYFISGLTIGSVKG